MITSGLGFLGAGFEAVGAATTASAARSIDVGASLLRPGSAMAPAERLSQTVVPSTVPSSTVVPQTGTLHFPVDLAGGDLVMPNGFGGFSGVNGSGGHNGVDIGNGCVSGKGRKLLACVDGFVEGDEFGSGGGRMRIIGDNFGNFYRYHHLDSYEESVVPGDLVTAGQVIGYMGNSGNTNWSHLHFEVWIGGLSTQQGGTVVDPEPRLPLPIDGVTTSAQC